MSMSQRSIAAYTTRRPYDSTPFRSHARSHITPEVLHRAYFALKRNVAAGKGLAHHDDEEAHAIERELKRIKGYLWNGNHREALACIDGLANDIDDLEDVPTTYPGIKAFRKGVDEFRTYVRRNAHTIASEGSEQILLTRSPARSEKQRRRATSGRPTNWFSVACIPLRSSGSL